MAAEPERSRRRRQALFRRRVLPLRRRRHVRPAEQPRRQPRQAAEPQRPHPPGSPRRVRQRRRLRRPHDCRRRAAHVVEGSIGLPTGVQQERQRHHDRKQVVRRPVERVARPPADESSRRGLGRTRRSRTVDHGEKRAGDRRIHPSRPDAIESPGGPHALDGRNRVTAPERDFTTGVPCRSVVQPQPVVGMPRGFG